MLNAAAVKVNNHHSFSRPRNALWHRLQPVGLEGFKRASFRNLLG
jgi:hypothetical protein